MRALLILMAIALTGCVSQGSQTKLNAVHVGMSKSEVIEVMGNPDRTSADSGVEYLVYQLADGTDGGTAAACAGAGVLTVGLIYLAEDCRGGEKDDFFVRLVNGQVDAYGRVGDFNSTRDPAITVNQKISEE